MLDSSVTASEVTVVLPRPFPARMPAPCAAVPGPAAAALVASVVSRPDTAVCDVPVPVQSEGGRVRGYLTSSRLASLLSTAGQESTTTVLPAFVTGLAGGVPLAIAGMEAVGHAGGMAARFGGAEIALRRPRWRGLVSLVGHAGMGLASALLALSGVAWQAATVRVGSWAARGLRTPLRPAQASEVTTVDRMGRRLGVERSIDAVGAALGPVLALLFLTFLEVRTVILLAVLPAVAAVAVSARANRRRAAQPGGNPTRPDLDVLQPDAVWQLPSLRSRIDQLRRGRLGRFLLGVAIYETANIAAVLLLLRATKLLPAGTGPFSQLQLVALLYIGYQLSAAVCASWAGALADRIGTGPIIAGGATCLLTAYVGFALAGTNELLLLAVCFVLAGAAAGAVDAAEYTGVGRLASPEIRWTAFGTLAALQSDGRAIATLTAGALWTFVAPEAGLLFCAPLLVVVTILFTVRADRPARAGHRMTGTPARSKVPSRRVGLPKPDFGL